MNAAATQAEGSGALPPLLATTDPVLKVSVPSYWRHTWAPLSATCRPVEKKENLKTKINGLLRQSVFCRLLSAHLSLPWPWRAPPPSPEASTSHPPPSQCRVRAGPCEDEDAQLGVGSCEERRVGVHAGVQKVMKSGTRWGGGAGQQSASGLVVARSGPWSAAARDGQSWVVCD